MSIQLAAQPRTKLGSRYSRRLRASGRLPASIQGEGKPNLDLSIDLAEFLTARRKHENLFDLQLQGGGVETVVVRELQYDQLGEHLVHVEFRRVVRGREMESDVDLVFVGQYREGVLTPTHSTIRLRALPSKLPDALEVIVERLQIDHILRAKDLPLPEGVKLGCDPELTVAVVTAADGEVVPEEVVEGAAPELIKKPTAKTEE
jgi:large subunit ribosomal protein L25